MCDYSLHGVPNRLAVHGDQLITFRFSTGSIGLADVNSVTEGFREKPQRGMWAALRDYYCASPENIIRENVIRAVCVPPGARPRLRVTGGSRENRFCECQRLQFFCASCPIHVYDILLATLKEGLQCEP